MNILKSPLRPHPTLRQRWHNLVAWDRWIANDFDATEDEIVLRIKHLLHVRGRRMDFHKFSKADNPGCFHTHPSYAIRIVVWGGYVEELWPSMEQHVWSPGDIGLVQPDYCHRISRLLNGTSSYSLWLRGRVTHDIRICGPGYDEMLLSEKPLSNTKET